MLLSGATASFLRELYLSEAPFSALVENDMLYALRFHYSQLPRLLAAPERARNSPKRAGGKG